MSFGSWNGCDGTKGSSSAVMTSAGNEMRSMMRSELARFDRHPFAAFKRRHPRRAGIAKLVPAGVIKMRERNRHRAVGDFIN